MGKKKEEEVVDEEVTETEAEEAEVEETEEKGSKKGSATVVDKNGAFVRSYSAEEHGKDYKALAKGYAGKIGGSVK